MKNKLKTSRKFLAGGIGATVGGCIILGSCIKSFGAEGDPGGKYPFGLNENHPYGILTGAYETPHVKWAKPYAGGEIRALVMAPTWSQRETVELAQRLSFDYTVWMAEAFSKPVMPKASDQAFLFFQPPARLVDRLLRECLLKKYDVIVVGKLNWEALPAKQRFELLKKVSEGTGLVYINPPEGNEELKLVFSREAAPEGVNFICSGVPFSFLPRLRDKPTEKIIRAGLFGKGRVVALDYGEKAPDEISSAAAGWPALTPQWDLSDSKEGYMPPDKCPEIEFVPYEYYQSLVARAVLWASGKSPEARLSEISLPATVDYPASTHNFEVTSVSAPSGALLSAKVRSRYDYERVYDIPAQPVGGKQLTLPEVPAGEYFLDVWLVDSGGKVFDWASRGFTVKTDIEIKEISLAGESYNPGDEIKGEARLSQPAAADEILMAELWDNYGRKISEKRLEGEGGRYFLFFKVARPLTIMHRIVVRIIKSEREVCISHMDFPVRARLRRDDFNEVVWSGVENQFLTHLMLRKLSKYDQADAIDIGWRGATGARNIAAAKLVALPYTSGFGLFGAKIVPAVVSNFPTRPELVYGKIFGCMSSPITLEAIDQWGKLQSDIFGPYGPLAWTHGDESFYSPNPDTCWSGSCLDAFREYLQGVYPDLLALNREWNTAFKTWKEVIPLTYEDAYKTGNYAPWIEHRLATQQVWARFYGHTGKALSVNDPGARVGFDGDNGFGFPNGGINWWRLKDHVGIMQVYIGNSQEMEIIRSFANGQLTGMWYGTYGLTWNLGPNTVAYHHFFPWYSLFHGLNSTWFWTMGSPGPLSGYAPDLTSLPFMQASRNALREIKAGPGKLLLSGKLQDDSVAIHFSEVSHIADSLFSNLAAAELAGGQRMAQKSPVCQAYIPALADFNKALEHGGLQYRYLAYEEVEKGALTDRGYKVFIMPHSRAVSEAEATAIRKFVNEGGLLIADIMPGILNGHGTKQKDSMLADLFPAHEPGKVNMVGNGRTVLLGDKLAGYGSAAVRNMAGWKKLGGRHRILAELLEKEAGIKPPVVVTHKGKGEMPPTEIFRLKSGDVEYMGFLRDYNMYDNGPYPAVIRFARKSHLYDMRAGKYLGFTDKVDTAISYEAQLYAMLPCEVASVNISAPDRVMRGGSTALKLGVNPAGRVKAILCMLRRAVMDGILDRKEIGRVKLNILRLEVIGPSGEQLPWYARNITAENGKAEYEIQWALNEKPGKYILQIKDVASGVVGRKTVELK